MKPPDVATPVNVFGARRADEARSSLDFKEEDTPVLRFSIDLQKILLEVVVALRSVYRPVSLFLLLVVSLAGCGGKADAAAQWNKAVWIKDALDVLRSGQFPRVKAISYWHEDFNVSSTVRSELRVDSSEAASLAYRAGIGNNGFVSNPEFEFKSGAMKLVPSPAGIYISAFPDFGATEDEVSLARIFSFEELVGKPVGWAYFSHNWYRGREFPWNAVNVLREFGRLPFVRLMLRSHHGAVDPVFTLRALLDGKFDSDLARWADEAKKYFGALCMEFGTEMNGDWFPWSGASNGGGKTNGYGDPDYPDGPERFRDAYRRIINIFRAHGATNVTWFFHADANPSPKESWNRMEKYYPGDDYIDWVGLSVYGPQTVKEPYVKFVDVLRPAYEELTKFAPSKPLSILEWGITEGK